MLKHYVEFLYPGAFFCESTVKEIPRRDRRCFEIPKGAYGYHYFDIEEIVKNGEVLNGERKNLSPYTFLVEKIYTLEDVKREMPNKKTLINNMKSNGYRKVVKTIKGNFQPFHSRDKALFVH